MNLIGKKALITGVSREKGIGCAIAKEFAAQGADLFLLAGSAYDQTMPWGTVPGEIVSMVNEMKSHGRVCEVLEVDLGDSTATVGAFFAALSTLGTIDVLVNNAACDIECDIFSVSEELLTKHFSVNVNANIFLCAEFIRAFKKGSGGRIINLTSGQSLGPMPNSLAYAISKSAIEGLTISLSASAGKEGITVNAIDPGPTDTGWMNAELKKDIATKSIFNRVGMPTDAAKLAAFLASDESAWITGQIIRSRGGL